MHDTWKKRRCLHPCGEPALKREILYTRTYVVRKYYKRNHRRVLVLIGQER